MPRVHFNRLSRPSEYVEALLPRPPSTATGYTPVMLVAEWLTLNCRDDWACRARPQGLIVRFRSPDDRDRALARFAADSDVVVGLHAGPHGPARRRPGRRAA